MKNFLIFILLFLNMACMSLLTMTIVDTNQTLYIPDSTKESVIIFLEPSSFWSGRSRAPIIDITENEYNLVGIPREGQKVAYVTKPGEHIFMGMMLPGRYNTPTWNVSFLKADLKAGKTYYVLITRSGSILAYAPYACVLKPIQKQQKEKDSNEYLNSEEFKKWNAECIFVENNESTYQWFNEYLYDIKLRKNEHFEEWSKIPDDKKLILESEDGI